MMETLKPSILESRPITNTEEALDFIAKRGDGAGALKKNRIKFGEEILKLDMLPHISISKGDQIKKA